MMRGYHRAIHQVTAATLLILLVVPGVLTCAGIRIVDIGARLPEYPGFPTTVHDAKLFRYEFGEWFKKSLSIREMSREWHAWFSVALPEFSSDFTVILGEDGWLFYGQENVIEQYRRLKPADDHWLAGWTERFVALDQACTQRGSRFVVMIGPNKPTIYGQHLPDPERRIDRPDRREVLMATLRERGLTVVDPTQALRQHAQTQRVYHKTDTHWNDLGAAIAADQLFNALDHPGYLQLITSTTVENQLGGDLARMAGLKRIMREEVPQLHFDTLATPRQQDGTPMPQPLLDAPFVLWQNEADAQARQRITTSDTPQLGVALCFVDSFGGVMSPHLARMFTKTIFVDTRKVDLAMIDQHHPDVVLLEMVERQLMKPAEEVLD